MYKIMSSESRDSFTSSFPIWMPFISCLIDWTRAISMMLNRIGESKHPRLIPDLRGKAFSLSVLSMMLTVGFGSLLKLVSTDQSNFFLTANLCMPVWPTPQSQPCSQRPIGLNSLIFKILFFTCPILFLPLHPLLIQLQRMLHFLQHYSSCTSSR